MIINRWIAPIITLSILTGLTGGCGKDDKTVSQQALKQRNQSGKPYVSLPEEEVNFRIGIYEAYLRLRDGVAPYEDAKAKREVLQTYIDSFQKVLEVNKSVAPPAGEHGGKCQRFLRLYENVGLQLTENYTKLLDAPLDEATQVNVVARLQTLRLFEAGLFSLVLFKAEAGYSDLDPSVRYTCRPKNRKQWETAILRSHQGVENTHFAFFGQTPIGNPINASSAFSEFNRRHTTQQNLKKYTFIGGELVASIIAWSKGVQPLVDKAILAKTGEMTLEAAGRTAWGRVIKFVAGAVYVTGLVTLDRYLRKNVDYLKDPPQIQDSSTLSSWERLIKFGEEFVVAGLVSPPLYFAYLRLIATTERQRALDFLTENEWVLVDAEERYGSVDAALKNLKEVAGL